MTGGDVVGDTGVGNGASELGHRARQTPSYAVEQTEQRILDDLELEATTPSTTGGDLNRVLVVLGQGDLRVGKPIELGVIGTAKLP